MAKRKVPEEKPKDATTVILEQNMGKYPVVIVLGVSQDGNINLDTNLTSYPMIQYFLSKTSFNLFVHETSPKKEAVQE